MYSHFLRWMLRSLIGSFFFPSTVQVAQSNSLGPLDYTVYGILQARIIKTVAIPFPRGSSQPRDRTQVSWIAGGFFTSWATGKTKNIAVGSLTLLQRIFPTWESNCIEGRFFTSWAYQGSPSVSMYIFPLYHCFSCIPQIFMCCF